jgi:hypothetical protein
MTSIISSNINSLKLKAIDSVASKSFLNDSDESKMMNDMVNIHCEKWIGNNKSKLEQFKNETIELLANIHREYIAVSIKNEICGPNIHSQYNSIMIEFQNIKQQIIMMSNNEETMRSDMKTTRNEIKKQFDTNNEITKNIKDTSKKVETKGSKSSEPNPFVSQKAKEFADENGIKAEDVEGTGAGGKIKITDIRKVMTGSSAKASSKKSTNTKTTAVVTKKICCGVSKSGSPCGSSGSVIVRGSWYCKKHVSQGEDIIANLEEEEFEEYDETKDKIVPSSSFASQMRELSVSSVKSLSKDDIKINNMLNKSTKSPIINKVNIDAKIILEKEDNDEECEHSEVDEDYEVEMSEKEDNEDDLLEDDDNIIEDEDNSYEDE